MDLNIQQTKHKQDGQDAKRTQTDAKHQTHNTEAKQQETKPRQAEERRRKEGHKTSDKGKQADKHAATDKKHSTQAQQARTRQKQRSTSSEKAREQTEDRRGQEGRRAEVHRSTWSAGCGSAHGSAIKAAVRPGPWRPIPSRPESEAGSDCMCLLRESGEEQRCRDRGGRFLPGQRKLRSATA